MKAVSVYASQPLFPQRETVTSSHSEAKEGKRAVDDGPALQFDSDPQRPARPPSSSPSGEANRSESDLDRLRVRARLVGLARNAGAGAGVDPDPGSGQVWFFFSAFGFWSALARLLSGAISAIVWTCFEQHRVLSSERSCCTG